MHNSVGFHSPTSSSEHNLMDKVGPALQSLLNTLEVDDSYSVRIIIVVRNQIALDTTIARISSLTPRIQKIQSWRFISAVVFTVPINYIEEIACITEVKKIWLDQQFNIPRFNDHQPETPKITELLGPTDNPSLSTMSSENYSQYYNGTNVIVALLDTGIDIFHPDLVDSIIPFGGVSMVEGDPFPLDFHGHGTFCAGIITGNGILNGNYSGVAPGTDILNVKVLSYLGVGLWSWIISGIEYAITHGADIISMCFSMPGYPGDPVHLAIEDAIRRGMIVVSAAGDDGPAFSSVTSPGMIQNAITIGAFNEFTQQPASFSGRGPTLSFHSKPDLLAAGVNIISCRPTTNSELPINLNDLFMESNDYGIPINDNYTMVSSTSAAAANVTGAVASLLQHSKLLSAEEVKILLQQTAIQLPNIPQNVQGAGLINIHEAHTYLVENNLNNSLSDQRLFSPSFPSTGYVVSQNSSRNISAFVTSYGSILAIIESWQNNIFTHMIQGGLGLKYNNRLSWLSDMYILRETHNLTSTFSIVQSVITDYSVICVISFESWASINAFRMNLTVINLEPSYITNLTVISLWETDLLFNQSIEMSNDTCSYNFNDDIIYVHDSNNGNSSYIGFTGSILSAAHEINTSANIRSQLHEGGLLSNNVSSQNLSVAMEWFLTSQLNSSKFMQFSQYIGVDSSYLGLNQSIAAIKSIKSFDNYTDLAILSSNLSRIGLVNQPYTSDILVMNLGNIAVNDTVAAFLINSTESQTQTFFSKYIQLGNLDPYEFVWVNASWNPTEVDIYSAYWMVGPQTLINQIVLYFMGIISEITAESNFLDNFFARNIFIKDYSYKMHSLFPDSVPIAPHLIYFPNDNAIFNLSLTTNHPLTNLQLTPLAGNLPLDWLSLTIVSKVERYGSVQIIVSIPQTPKAGYFYRKLNLTSDGFHLGEIWVNFTIRYPAGRVLFYKPSLNFSFQQDIQISDLMTIWTERLDTIYGGYFDFYNICIANNYDVDDFGILKQFYPGFSLDSTISLPFELPYEVSTFNQNSSLISNYDLIVICDPEVNLSQGEINTLIDFGSQGGSLFFWLEPEIESEHYSINSILNPFGIRIDNSSNSIINQTFLPSLQHEISSTISQIRLFSFITFENLSNSKVLTQYDNQPTLLLNDSKGKILCLGDSSLFNTSCLSQADNLPFLNNSLNWLLKEKINISLFINQKNESEPLRIDQHLSISIHLTSINGSDLFSNLTLYSLLITPANRTVFMILFHVKDGWYNTIYLDEWLNETGTYYLIIYADSISKVSTYSIHQLTLEEPTSSPPDEPNIDLNWVHGRRIFWAFIISFIVTLNILGFFFYQRSQWKRQMSIVELKEKIKREVSNVLSEYQLYIKEIEGLIMKPGVHNPDKLRMVLDKQERKKELLDKLKKLGKKI